MKKDVEVDREDSDHKNPGKPRKATILDFPLIMWTLPIFERSVGTFSARNIQQAVNMNTAI